MPIPRQQFIKSLRGLGYKFDHQTNRTYTYREIGGTHHVAVPKQALLDECNIHSILRQCGCTNFEIREIIESLNEQPE